MTYEESTLALRLTAVVLAAWALGRLVMARCNKWKTVYTPKERVTWNALFFGCLAAGEGALENVIQHNQEGPRSVLRLIFLVFVLLVTYTSDDRRIVINPENHQE